MRKELLFIAVFLGMVIGTSTGFAKSPCANIKQRKDKVNGYLSFNSPLSPVMVTKWIKKKDTTLFLKFSIDGGSEVQDEQDEELVITPVKGLLVHFVDGTTWKNDTAYIRHHLRNGTSVFSYVLTVDEKSFNLFTAKQISKFELAGLTQKEISQAAFIPDYLRCLKP